MFNINKALIAASLFLSAGTVATAAVAEERTIEVSYSDLNLDHISGQRALASRISNAAEQVCGSASGRTSLQEASRVRRCIRGATEIAMASLNESGQVQVAAKAGGSSEAR
jgi:UrcA family protein